VEYQAQMGVDIWVLALKPEEINLHLKPEKGRGDND